MKTSKTLYIIIILSIILFAADNLFSQSGWVQQNSGSTGNLTGLTFLNINTGYITGNPLLKTTNGGTNWVGIPGLPAVVHVVWSDTSIGYACNNTVYKSTDGGVTWNDLNQNYFGRISFSGNSTGYSICLPEQGPSSTVYNVKKTINGGVTWSTVMQFSSFNTAIIWYGFFYLQAINNQVAYFTLWHEDHDIGHYQWTNLYKTINGGASWNNVLESTTSRYLLFHFPSADTGYIVAQDWPPGSYRVLRYSNNNYTNVYTTGSEIRSLYFTNNSTGYILAGTFNIFKTTNRGNNWVQVTPPTTTQLNSLFFYNSLTGYAVGNNGVIFKTTSGGELPRSVSGTVKFADNNQPVSSGYVKALSYDSVSHTIITLDSAQIQPNGSYLLPNCPPVYIDIMAYENDEEELSFVPTYHLSSVSWQGSVKVKPDSNLTNIDIGVKRILNNGGMMKIAGYIYSNYILDYTGLKDAIIYAKSNDNYKGYSISISSGYYCIDSLPAGSYSLYVDRMGCVSAENTVQLVNSNLENVNFYLDDYIVPVITQTSDIPMMYELFQNYPNPFNPETNIEFTIPNTSNVQLMIYDLQGRLLRTLVNGELAAGKYKVNWNASNYSSGVYFYKLTADGFSDAKRMVLVK